MARERLATKETSGEPEKAPDVPLRPPSYAGGKKVAACKIPSGVILRAFRFSTHPEPVLGGGVRDVKIAEQVGAGVRVNGPAHAFGAMPQFRIVGGYAITEGIPEDMVEAWLRDNKDSMIVRNEMIAFFKDLDSAVSFAKGNRKERSGLEPLEQDGDPRRPARRPQPGLRDTGTYEDDGEK